MLQWGEHEPHHLIGRLIETQSVDVNNFDLRGNGCAWTDMNNAPTFLILAEEVRVLPSSGFHVIRGEQFVNAWWNTVHAKSSEGVG